MPVVVSNNTTTIEVLQSEKKTIFYINIYYTTLAVCIPPLV